jgi:predicted enzyme related to lactoylglutathione lyase
MGDEPRAALVHLELHTGDRSGAEALLREVCGWRTERVAAGSGLYQAFDDDLGGAVGGGIVECRTRRSLWLPYVEVDGIAEATQRARRRGASILLEPREGPAGWRSVVATSAGAELALWQPKR